MEADALKSSAPVTDVLFAAGDVVFSADEIRHRRRDCIQEIMKQFREYILLRCGAIEFALSPKLDPDGSVSISWRPNPGLIYTAQPQEIDEVVKRRWKQLRTNYPHILIGPAYRAFIDKLPQPNLEELLATGDDAFATYFQKRIK